MKGHMFSNQDLKKLLIPLMIEQLLTLLMGTIDIMMVSNIGSAEISGVSLVDTINILVIYVFTALASGGVIVCSQYMGRQDLKGARHSANQLIFVITVLSVIIAGFCVLFRRPMLKLIFGQVERSVMEAASTYFFYTALSFPFIALYDAGSSIFRSQNNSRLPMTISIISNVMNVCLNAVLIFGVHLGVAGAAIATLASRIFCAVVILYKLRSPKETIRISPLLTIRPDFSRIKNILAIGLPSGLENGMFQFGKIIIQSTVSTLGTTAMAAQAMTAVLEELNGVAPLAVGIGMMTVVGQCMGADEKEEAAYYIKKLSGIAEIVIIISCLLVFLITKPVTILGGMEPESARLCITMMTIVTIFKPISWVGAFIPSYGMRAAGDVKFSMIISCITMWTCRVSLTILFCRYLDFGLKGVWLAMAIDWTIRAVIYWLRFRSGKWAEHQVI